MKDLKRSHEGAEITTNDKPLTRYYNSDKARSEIDSDIGIYPLKAVAQTAESSYF